MFETKAIVDGGVLIIVAYLLINLLNGLFKAIAARNLAVTDNSEALMQLATTLITEMKTVLATMNENLKELRLLAHSQSEATTRLSEQVAEMRVEKPGSIAEVVKSGQKDLI